MLGESGGAHLDTALGQVGFTVTLPLSFPRFRTNQMRIGELVICRRDNPV